eukprot:gene24239-29310_t
MVAELRAKTDAPMMECKKALTEAEGDMAKAEELLRVKLGTKAGKAASRVTAEGVVTSFVNGTTGAMIEVNCETDFVTKNDSFLALANAAAKLVAEHNPADIAALGELPYSQDGFGPTLEEVRKGLIGKIGENMSFRRFKRAAGAAKIANYLHGTRIGVLVEYEGDETAAKDVAMHVAASNPQFLNASQVSEEAVAKEKEIFLALNADKIAGKPENIVENMVKGRIAKFLAEASLVEQPFVKDPEVKVGDLAKKAGAEIVSFVRYEVGEGIEKVEVDFAAEVAAQVAATKQGCPLTRAASSSNWGALLGGSVARPARRAPRELVMAQQVSGRQPRYKRILLKLSGEALMGAEEFGIDPKVLDRMALEIGQLVGIGVQVGLVIGGGNLFRGAALSAAGMDRVTGDHM